MRRGARLALDDPRLERLGVVALDDGDLVAVRLDRASALCDVLELDARRVSTSRCATTKSAAAGPKSERSREDQPSNSISAREKRPQRASVSFWVVAAAVDDVEVLDPLAHEQLLELRFLLDVLLLVADLDAVERRHGDVDVAALDQLLHLAVEEREDQRADVRAVDVGVGHHDHAVVAQLLEVELLADARCRSR